ncbi:MAG: hypothetical protein IPJ65_09820 [Archangiaceae bacterium]|nr:hypothetical protein [Archangiaceae bacterium]
MRFSDHELTTGFSAQLDFGWYLDNGFEVGARAMATVFLTTQSYRQRLGGGGSLYARYLFLQEQLRPWVGLELAVLYVDRPSDSTGSQQQAFAGPGASVGLEYFVTNEISLGARTMGILYFGVNNNAPLRPSYGGTVSMQVYF